MNQTYGIFAVTPRSISIKDDRDNGWVADVKWAFMPGAKPERKLELEHLSVLKGAAASDGIRMELTPRLDGEFLPPIMLGVTQRGNITIGEEGEVLCITRITLDELELAGLGIDAILSASNCLECTVSDQPTLDEGAKQLEGQGALFGDDEAEPAAPSGQDDVRTENAGDAPAPWDCTLILEVRTAGDRPGSVVKETREYVSRVEASQEDPNDPTIRMIRTSPRMGGGQHETLITWNADEFDPAARTATFRQSLKASDRLVDDLSKYGWELRA
ncbi:hypothetical protein [Deinococcus ruber]|uniref:Uncharacterized protein n=1 Tax=Deinococcus ruber TaxID=1848197 RepID=A0A918FEY3_9DEIO|nr:hypothetical protein [Deinococcus ruber]GGR31266.1 hypothetical protein GCM10008957_47420 [Deinococcus ruber]